jgi:hypothetical protein
MQWLHKITVHTYEDGSHRLHISTPKADLAEIKITEAGAKAIASAILVGEPITAIMEAIKAGVAEANRDDDPGDSFDPSLSGNRG